MSTGKTESSVRDSIEVVKVERRFSDRLALDRQPPWSGAEQGPAGYQIAKPIGSFAVLHSPFRRGDALRETRWQLFDLLGGTTLVCSIVIKTAAHAQGVITHAAIKNGDRLVLLGETFLERTALVNPGLHAAGDSTVESNQFRYGCG